MRISDEEATQALLGSELPNELFDDATVVISRAGGLIVLDDGTPIDVVVRVRPDIQEEILDDDDDEGIFWLIWAGERQGPYASREEAWADYKKTFYPAVGR